jgi:glucose/arabinose dehydrogenase
VRTTAAVVTAALATALLAACSDDTDLPAPAPSASSQPSTPTTTPPASTPTTSAPRPTATGPVKLTVAGTVATGINVPWGLAFLPDRSALVAERDTAKVKRIAGSSLTEVGTIDGVDPSSEGGLLGLAVDPQFTGRPYVYVYFSTGEDNRIARYTYRDNRLSDPRVILDGIPMAAVHNGGRMAFGRDGFLYVGTGDGRERPNSQDPDSLGGKILRITGDGRPAPGNPRGDSPVYSLGHRNVQGLAFDEQGRLYAAEFGQNEWDELNAITAGANYGWPAAEGAEGLDGMVDPIAQWRTDDASPSGIAYAQGTIFMAGLRGERLWAIPVADGRRTGEPQAFFTGRFGRLRTVVTAPDGSLWLSTSNTDGRGDVRDGDDRILRVTISR